MPSAVIVGSGPSAAQIDERIYRHTVIAVNGGILHAPKCDYWFTADPGALEFNYMAAVKAATCKIVYQTIDNPQATADNMAVDVGRIVTYTRRQSRDLWFNSPGIIMGSNSAHCAAHFAHQLGCSPIYLIGCDCTYKDGKKYAWELQGDNRGRHFSGAISRHIAWEKFSGRTPGESEYAIGADGESDANLRTDVGTWSNIVNENPTLDLRDCSHGGLVGYVRQASLEELYNG